MSAKGEKWKRDNSFFLNSKTGRIQYNTTCLMCECNCKQSFKICLLNCPFYKLKGKSKYGK